MVYPLGANHLLMKGLLVKGDGHLRWLLDQPSEKGGKSRKARTCLGGHQQWLCVLSCPFRGVCITEGQVCR